MKKIKVKYAIIAVLMLFEIVSLTLMYKSSHNKEVVLDEVKLKELIKNDMISIMIDDTGTGKYSEYSNSTFPGSDYKFNSEKSQCLNEKGEVVKSGLTFSGSKAVLTSNEGTHCTLYFDKAVDNPPKINSITATNVTANSIKVSVSASDDKRISQYCYAIQTGANVNVTNAETCELSSTHEFTGLTKAQAYTIKVRVVDSADQDATNSQTISTNELSCSFKLTYIEGSITAGTIVVDGKINLELTYPSSISVSSYKINGTSVKTLTLTRSNNGTYTGEITDTSRNVATCSVDIKGKTESGYCLGCGSGSSTSGTTSWFGGFYSTEKECQEKQNQYSGSTGGVTWGGSCICSSCTGCASGYTQINGNSGESTYNFVKCYKITS